MFVLYKVRGTMEQRSYFITGRRIRLLLHHHKSKTEIEAAQSDHVKGKFHYLLANSYAKVSKASKSIATVDSPADVLEAQFICDEVSDLLLVPTSKLKAAETGCMSVGLQAYPHNTEVFRTGL
jgi:hypothetical protein